MPRQVLAASSPWAVVVALGPLVAVRVAVEPRAAAAHRARAAAAEPPAVVARAGVRPAVVATPRVAVRAVAEARPVARAAARRAVLPVAAESVAMPPVELRAAAGARAAGLPERAEVPREGLPAAAEPRRVGQLAQVALRGVLPVVTRVRRNARRTQTATTACFAMARRPVSPASAYRARPSFAQMTARVVRLRCATTRRTRAKRFFRMPPAPTGFYAPARRSVTRWRAGQTP